jgi:2-deoxy-D-gluconate 3-dehydrogenase
MTLDAFSLQGRVALVTGASRGLGRGMALALAEAGADVAVTHHSRDAGPVRAAIEKLGRRCVAVQADLGRGDAIPRVMDAVLSAFGRVDILVNNAGIIRRAPALEYTEKDWDDVMGVNLKSVFFLAQAAARDMMKRKRGKIVNVASLLSFSGGITVPAYSASKGGVAQVTKALANEWAEHGVNVNAIAPGYMVTDNTEALRNDPVRNAEIGGRIPCRRWGTPEDLAGAVVFLASGASDYVHGHVLVVDGGWMAR